MIPNEDFLKCSAHFLIYLIKLDFGLGNCVGLRILIFVLANFVQQNGKEEVVMKISNWQEMSLYRDSFLSLKCILKVTISREKKLNVQVSTRQRSLTPLLLLELA